jgi:hypothetical protein
LNGKILSYTNIYSEWLSKGKTESAAIELTLQQVDALEEMTGSDELWDKLLEISARGRNEDAWLAADWPAGFDELVLCVPLCKLVDWECAKCTIGRRQENNSCAHDYSLFGLIGELVRNGDRDGLKEHIKKIQKMLRDERFIWNVHTCELETLRT